MPRRLLNIASIACLVACVALMGMWVRSYRWLDIFGGRFTDSCIDTMPGRLVFQFSDDFNSLFGSVLKWWEWRLTSQYILHESVAAYSKPGVLRFLGFDASFDSENWVFVMPFWFLVLVSGSLAMICRLRWPPWRFTLRSLFVATTFLAVVLGMIAWLDRAWIGK